MGITLATSQTIAFLDDWLWWGPAGVHGPVLRMKHGKAASLTLCGCKTNAHGNGNEPTRTDAGLEKRV